LLDVFCSQERTNGKNRKSHKMFVLPKTWGLGIG
jgi:hypothetical protein